MHVNLQALLYELATGSMFNGAGNGNNQVFCLMCFKSLTVAKLAACALLSSTSVNTTALSGAVLPSSERQQYSL